MKLLFDQNISFRLVDKIANYYPNAKQVKDVGLVGLPDIQIWKFAKENNFTIVTFDADFYDLTNIKGHPPKIIWLRFGNTTTNNIAKLFIEKFELIEDFILNPENKEIACLEVNHL